MTAVFGARRRAEEFNSLVEDPSTGGRHDARYAEFLDVVASLRDVPAPEARPEFVADLRERLMHEADTVLGAIDDEARLTLPSRRTTRRPARERRLAAAAAGLAIVGATTTMAVAAQSALPGDALYPLKRLIEGAETGIEVNEGDKGSMLLANASGRLDEITALSRDGALDDPIAVEDNLNTFTQQATEASELLLTDYANTDNQGSIVELRDFTGASMDTLTQLESVVPPEARDELLRAARIVTQIDAQALQACPTCGGQGIDRIPAILASSYDTSDRVASTPGTVLKVAPKRQKHAGDQQVSLPKVGDQSLPQGSVLGQGTQPPAGTSGGGTKQQPTDPIEELAQTLTGNDGSGSTSGPSGPSAPTLPDPGQIVEDVTDPLLNP